MELIRSLPPPGEGVNNNTISPFPKIRIGVFSFGEGILRRDPLELGHLAVILLANVDHHKRPVGPIVMPRGDGNIPVRAGNPQNN